MKWTSTIYRPKDISKRKQPMDKINSPNQLGLKSNRSDTTKNRLFDTNFKGFDKESLWFIKTVSQLIIDFFHYLID